MLNEMGMYLAESSGLCIGRRIRERVLVVSIPVTISRDDDNTEDFWQQHICPEDAAEEEGKGFEGLTEPCLSLKHSIFSLSQVAASRPASACW
jgi:hypothetical protein